MRGYSGYATIEFPIERIKDLTTDEYRPIKDGDDLSRSEELVLTITGRSYFYPGKFYGPPEECYPDEGDTEIISITWNGKPFPWDLTPEEEEAVLEQISSEVSEDEGPDPDEYYDIRRDDDYY
jgi:hypothetical protein